MNLPLVERLANEEGRVTVERMNLQTLLGEMPKAKFVEDFYQRFPLSLPRAAQSLRELGTWEVLGEILTVSGADVFVARDGQPFPGPLPTNLEAAQALSREGYTVLVRHAEQHSTGLQQLAHSFQQDFAAPVNIHIYATPAGRHGFGWHFDAEDVFIIQTGGAKEYSLRKNTVHPWPLVETIAHDMGYQREIMPLMRVRLDAGDWLYIPCGYWHKAEAVASSETALSLALGVMSPAAIDVYDFARSQLLQSLVWRQRLPVLGAASTLTEEERVAQLSELLGQLAHDLSKTLGDERFIRAFLDHIAAR